MEENNSTISETSKPAINLEPSLPIHEWMALTLLISLLLVFTMMAIFNGESALPQTKGDPQYIIEQEIEVYLQGAITNPGSRQIKRGALIKDVLAHEVLLPEADISSMNLDKKVRKGQIIKVPGLKVETKKSMKAKKKRKEEEHLSSDKSKITEKSNSSNSPSQAIEEGSSNKK